MYEFSGMVDQTGSTTPVVEGTYVDVDVTATNIGGAVADGMLIAPIDPDAMYVMAAPTAAPRRSRPPPPPSWPQRRV